MKFLHISDLHIGKYVNGYRMLGAAGSRVANIVLLTILISFTGGCEAYSSWYIRQNPEGRGFSLSSGFFAFLAQTPSCVRNKEQEENYV